MPVVRCTKLLCAVVVGKRLCYLSDEAFVASCVALSSPVHHEAHHFLGDGIEEHLSAEVQVIFELPDVTAMFHEVVERLFVFHGSCYSLLRFLGHASRVFHGEFEVLADLLVKSLSYIHVTVLWIFGVNHLLVAVCLQKVEDVGSLYVCHVADSALTLE